MKGARHQLLAHAVLAQDQHGGITWGHLRDAGTQLAHRRRVAQQAARGLGRWVRRRGLPRSQRRLHAGHQPRVVPGLGDEVHRAQLERLHGQVYLGVGRHHDHGRCLLAAGQLAQHPKAGLAIARAGREVHVQQQHVGRQARQRIGQRRRVADGVHLTHPTLQQQARSQDHIGVVVEDQEAGRHGAGH
jgi:hypothetical protein